MPMDRQQLTQLINGGRSLAFNCFEIGRSIPADDEVGKLFKNKMLNNCLFFKIMERDATRNRVISTVQTLIYFPYNLNHVGEGGDSILFDDPGFHRALQLKTGIDPANEDSQIEYVMDLEILEMIYSLPTLDPFLLKSKAQQLDLMDRINPVYFNITDDDWNKIREPIRRKIRTLVQRAFSDDGASGGTVSESIEQHVSRFLTKIWEAKDIDGIEDFVASMEIPADRAPDLFFAWKAICFYQVQFEESAEGLREFFAWLGDDEVALPADWQRLHRDEKTRIEYALGGLRHQVRNTYHDIRQVLDSYELSYRMFVEESSPYEFQNFLLNADRHYLVLAASLSANIHSLKLWRNMKENFGARLRNENFSELIDTLSTLFDSRPPQDAVAHVLV